MRSNHQSDSDAFADWLDMNRKVMPVPSASQVEHEDLVAACKSSLQIDATNASFERDAVANAPPRTPWSQILAAADRSLPPAVGMPEPSNGRSHGKELRMERHLDSPIALTSPKRRTIGAMVNRVLSIAAVLAIVLAGTLTAYVQRDRLGFGGGGNEPEGLSFAEATGEDSPDPGLVYDVPSADDCTVEPLTVDQVMQKLDSRVDTTYLRDARATVMAEFGTPEFEGMEPVLEMPQATFDELAAIQREWLACALYGSPLQRWALETPALVQQEILARYYPVIDLALIEQDLTDLAAGKQNRLSGPTLTDQSLLPIVPSTSTGYYTTMNSEAEATLTVFWVRPDGTALLAFGSGPEDIEPYVNAAVLEQRLPNAWRFIKESETGPWLLDGSSSMGG
jgi:hypothetical protein